MSGPDRLPAPALAAGDRRWTESEVEAAAESCARALAVGGEGERPVAHAFDLAPEAIVAALGTARAGRVLAPVHPGWRPDEWRAFLDAVRPGAILTAHEARAPAEGWEASEVATPGFRPMTVWRPGEPVGSPPDPRAGALPPGARVLLRTSGTEGHPRIVCHSWEGLAENARAAGRRLGFGADGRWLATLAWAGVGGLAVIVRACVHGATVVFGPPRWAPAAVLEGLSAAAATHVSLVPAMLHELLDLGEGGPPEALEVALLGGAVTPPALVERAADLGWPVALTYGLTEAGSQVATAPPSEVRRAAGTVGRPLACHELRIGPGEEIELRGPAIFLGYAGAGARRPTDWWRTGDLGRLRPDGSLNVVGRRGERIVTGGANVDPGEVESVLSDHPEVVEVCVLGWPDEVWGEIVTALVVPSSGARSGLEGRLDAWARDRLSGPRAPRRWAFAGRLPRTAAGKVDRSAARALIGGVGDGGSP